MIRNRWPYKEKINKNEGQVLGIFLYQFIFIFLFLWLFIRRFISLFIQWFQLRCFFIFLTVNTPISSLFHHLFIIFPINLTINLPFIRSLTTLQYIWVYFVYKCVYLVHYCTCVQYCTVRTCTVYSTTVRTVCTTHYSTMRSIVRSSVLPFVRSKYSTYGSTKST